MYIGHVFGQTAIPLDQWKKTHSPGESLSDYYSGKSTEDKRHRISVLVFGVTILASLLAGYIVWQRVRKVRPFVVAEFEARRLERGDDVDDEKARENIILDEAENRVPDMVSLANANGSSVRILSRPTMFQLGSTDSRTALLLSPAGRSRSNTVLSAASTLTSPSLPHLPIGENAMFEEITPAVEERPSRALASPDRSRRPSHQRRSST